MPETENIKLTPLEKSILQVAIKRQIGELDKVEKKAASLGVDTTKAIQRDMNVLKDLETKLL